MNYPPTPAFGGYNFVPPKAPPAPVQGSIATVVPTLSSDTTARRPTIPSQQSSTDPTTTFRKSSAKMDVQHIDAASDSLEEGELSEPHSANRDSVSNSSPMSGDEELHATVDRPPTLEPPNNWHQRHRGKPSVPSRSQGPPQQNRNGPGMHSTRNDRIGASDRNFDPPSQPKGMGTDKSRGFLRSALAPKHNPSQPYQTSGTTKPINGYDIGVIRAVPSLLRREAQKAILDMRQCNVQFNDVIQETGVDPNHLKKLFAAIDIPIPSSNTPPPTLSKGPGHSVPPKEVAKPNSREPPSDKSDIDKAQMIKQLEREQRDKERREAEAKAAEMVRKREAAKEEEERQRRFVEVQAAREAFQKKIESLNLKKAASPGIPPTPISSTPVNAAVVKAHPQPILPTSSVLQVTTRIPGLLLGHTEETPNITGSGDADIVMKDAPVTTVPTRPMSTGVTPVNPSDSNGVSHLDRSNIVRRKRPMAADLYSESNPIRRKFGAQRSNCLIIEISEDEDEDSDSEQPPQEVGEDHKSAEASPLGTSGVSASGLNHALRRVQTAPMGGLTPNGADALRKKEAEIQRLKEQIMAAQQKKKTIKAASSGMPTPVATPSVGVGPTIPPSQNGASKTVADVTPSPAELLTKVKQSLPVIRPANECEQLANKTAEQGLKEAEKIKAKQLQILQNEKQQMAAKEAEEKRKLEEKAAKQLQEERERKKKQLQEIESAREKKRMAREKLKAERERIRRQEEEMQRQEEEMLREELDMDELQSSLTKELEVIGSSKQVIPSVQSIVQNGAEKQRTEIEAQYKMSEGPVTATEEPGEKLGPPVAITTSSASVPITSPSTTHSHHSADPIQTNGGKKETITSDIAPSVKTVYRSPSTAPELDDMDIDVHPKPSTPVVVAAREDVEMDSGSASKVGEDSSSEKLDEDEKEVSDSSEENSSDEEDEDESMLDTPDNKPENPVGDTTRGPATLDTQRTRTTPAVLEPQPEETNTPKTAPTQPEKHTPMTVTAIDKAKPVPNVFVPYRSPLAIFKSFRHHPKFHEFNSSGLRSLLYSNHIDPNKAMCKYEVNGGVCNDDTCHWQHFRELSMGDDEILVELAENEGTTEEEKEEYCIGLRNTIMELKEKGIKDFATVAQGIAAYRRKFFGDETRVVKLQPPPPPHSNPTDPMNIPTHDFPNAKR